MPSGSLRAILWLAASGAAAGLALSACEGEEQLPAPRGGSGTTTAGSGAAGGAGGGGGGGGSSPAPNLCECSAALGEVDCSDCFNANAALGAPCAAEAAACSGDAGCDAIRLCVQACDDAACKQACILPFDADASHGLWRDVLMCVCGRCVEACAHKPALECDEGAGGAGGGAGGGGAGGGGVGGG